MSKTNDNNSGGFAKTTDFKWLGIGVAVFILIGFMMPTPESMLEKASFLFGADSSIDVALKAKHIQLTIALLATCVVFFATEAVPMPAVALIIGLVQLFFGITAPKEIALTYAHDAVWFIGGSLALGATLVKYGLDKRVGMLVVNLAGTKTRSIVIGILLGTAIPTAFVGEHAVAAMYVPKSANAPAARLCLHVSCRAPKLLFELAHRDGARLANPFASDWAAHNPVLAHTHGGHGPRHGCATRMAPPHRPPSA